ncbi:MAG: LysR family transcriptional regulator, partial [Hydrogenoanaerobacterium sp.]
MNIKHLEFFATVAQYGSINKAAQALYISQPHLSHIIKDIETDVGFALFQRTKQGVVLTPDGERFLEHSNVILQE